MKVKGSFGKRLVARWRLAIAGLAALLGAGAAFPLLVAAAIQLTGAGATFPYPFYSKAFYAYSQQNPEVTVNYQSIGSGGGIQQFIAGTVDFGASDVPMNEGELKQAKSPVIQLPTTLGGEAIAYNVPGVGSGLRLTRELVAAIYLGKVANWNDPAIGKLNPNFKLPELPITVVHRSDGSGTTYIFTDFLSHVSGEWKDKVGTGKSVQWPAQNSVGGKGNEGVAGQVAAVPGAIGYVELAYATENRMNYAKVQNQAGKFLYPSSQTVAAAAATKPTVSATDFSVVDVPGPDSYPISGYSWVLVHQKPRDTERAKLVKAVLEWLVTQGQAVAQSIDYVALPPGVQQQALRLLSQMEL